MCNWFQFILVGRSFSPHSDKCGPSANEIDHVVESAAEGGVVEHISFAHVCMDFPAIVKNITYPTDNALLE